jgi:hypothetical protein
MSRGALAIARTRPQNALVFGGYTAAALVLGTVLLYRRDTRDTRLGRPRQIDPALLARIVAMHAAGSSYRQIAAAMTDEGVPTPTGRADFW